MTVAASLLIALLPWGPASAEETPSVEPELARTGIAAAGALLTAGALIGAGLFIRNRRSH